MGANTSTKVDFDEVSSGGDSSTFVSSMSTMIPGVKARGGASSAGSYGNLSMWATAKLEGGAAVTKCSKCGMRCREYKNKGKAYWTCLNKDCTNYLKEMHHLCVPVGGGGGEVDYDDYTINTSNYRAALSDMRGRF